MIDIVKMAEFVKSHKNFKKPNISMVLGSGLGFIADEFEGNTIEYSEIPNFPKPTVEGHSGKIAFGTFKNNTVMLFKGRFHFYEGYSMNTMTVLPRLAKLCGAKLYFATNAAGGVNTSFKAGDLMVINDHLNLMGTNPLIGSNDTTLGVRFPDMTNAYNQDLSNLIKKCGEKNNFPMKEGVYAGLTGPSYETPAEIRMLRILGADAVGMSTVPEIIAARHCGMKTCGISCITNLAAGVSKNPLSHEEVLETTENVKHHFASVVSLFLESVNL